MSFLRIQISEHPETKQHRSKYAEIILERELSRDAYGQSEIPYRFLTDWNLWPNSLSSVWKNEYIRVAKMQLLKETIPSCHNLWAYALSKTSRRRTKRHSIQCVEMMPSATYLKRGRWYSTISIFFSSTSIWESPNSESHCACFWTGLGLMLLWWCMTYVFSDDN